MLLGRRTITASIGMKRKAPSNAHEVLSASAFFRRMMEALISNSLTLNELMIL